MSRIPELPGIPVAPRSEQEKWLRRSVAHLCRLDNERFPGSQPVSFVSKHLAALESKDYWVCEKSDGIRVLFFVCTNLETNDQMVFIIDRHNSYRELTGLYFPHHENPVMPLRNTVVDGELVVDFDPIHKTETLRFLAFDCLVVDEQNVMSRTLDKRYGRLNEWFYKPYAKMKRDHPSMAAKQPFDIRVKEISFSYHVERVFADIPALQHGNDGLIYTSVNTPYVPGTDQTLLKWKPPSENSIDFKLVLRFPPSRLDPLTPDLHAKPVFVLHVWCGHERGAAMYEQYDLLHIDDDEWEKLKSTGDQIDDRIVEVRWDSPQSQWRMMRFRDDKPHGNHVSVVENIIQSIADGVEQAALLARSGAIRNAWKARQGQPSGAVQQHHQQTTNYHHGPPPLPAVAVEKRYGPLAASRWSKVSGPMEVFGMKR